MAEEPIAFLRARQTPAARSDIPGAVPTVVQVRFDRGELNRILTVYGRMVAAGEWRDYAIDFREDVAAFSIYRRTSEMPLFRVEKRPKLRERQGMYAVIAASGQILKRGHELEQVLRVFDKMVMKARAVGG